MYKILKPITIVKCHDIVNKEADTFVYFVYQVYLTSIKKWVHAFKVTDHFFNRKVGFPDLADVEVTGH